MILQVLPDTHPKLKRVAHPADPTKAHHKTLARRLVETMRAHRAYGIAANQVHPGELVRVIAIDTPTYRGAMFNPEIIWRDNSGLMHCMKEGCLSVKEQVEVSRFCEVIVRFWTMQNEMKEIKFMFTDAHVVQHEIDHLDGILISDHKPKI